MAETKKKKTNTKKVTEKTKKVTTTKKKTNTTSNNTVKKNKASEKLAFRKSENFILGISIAGLLCMYISNILGIIITLAAFALSVSELKRSTLKITIAFILTATACIFFVVTYTNESVHEEAATDISSICEAEEILYEENAPLLVDSNSIFEDGITTITKTDLENYLIDNLNDKCDGYVEVYKDDNNTVNYDAYVKCKKNKYSCQTKGYSE